MSEITLERQGIWRYEASVDGKKEEVSGTAIFNIFCNSVKLYSWEIRPRKLWWGPSVKENNAIIIVPCSGMMTNVSKHYKYEFTMSLCDGYDMLVEMDLPTFMFELDAAELGWKDILEEHVKLRKQEEAR